MEKQIYRPISKIDLSAPFVIYRYGVNGTSEAVSDAKTYEQACDLARSDRARLRDLHRIDSLERHDILVTSTGLTRQISVPR